MTGKHPEGRATFEWEASSGNWRWRGRYPLDTDPDVIVLRAMLALRGLGSSADRVTKRPGGRKPGYLVDRTIALLTPDRGTLSIETASAIDVAERLEKRVVDKLRKQRIKKRLDELDREDLAI